MIGNNLLVKFPSVNDICKQVEAMKPIKITVDPHTPEYEYVEYRYKPPMMLNPFITSLITQGKVLTQEELFNQLDNTPEVKGLKDKQRKYWQARVYNRAWFSFIRETHLCAGLYKSLSYKTPMVYDEVIYNEVEDLAGNDVILKVKGDYIGGKIFYNSRRAKEFFEIKKNRVRDFHSDIKRVIPIELKRPYINELKNEVFLYGYGVIKEIEEQICLSLAI
jgi:hypothetical protein